ncbi:MAG: alkyl sulfatase dimerization domain-containing protein [Bacillota bacterium]|nr:alkyl sulfatase dimerization domain-containing protein [Bacillota bacterium]
MPCHHFAGGGLPVVAFETKETILSRAQGDFDNGAYARVAEVLNRVVFADPENMETRRRQPVSLPPSTWSAR